MAANHWGVFYAAGQEVYHCLEPGCSKHVEVGSRVRGRVLDAESCKKAINDHWPRVHDHKWVERRGPDGAVIICCREAGCGYSAVVGSPGKRGEPRSKDSCQNSVNGHWKAEHKFQIPRHGGGNVEGVRRNLLLV